MYQLAALPASLPEGVYRLDSEWSREQRAQASLGWGLACYRFDRYKAGKKELPTLLLDEDIDEFLTDAAEDSPNGRIAEPGEVASLVLYLASDAARHITGTTISIDGGATA